MKRAKRFLSVLLTLCMVLGMLPGTVFAANSSIPFTDVKKTDWFYEAVQYVYENGMMSGTGDTTFSPDTTTTRGMIVTILHRMEGKPTAAGETFTDVAAGQYYADAVAWASANGIVSGYGNNLFGPNDPITREQMAAILYRYVQHKGYDDAVKGDVSAFADGNQVSSYAVEAMNWAVGVGLISGVGNNMLDPTGSATRAQVATILMRFCEHIASSGQPEVTYTVNFDYNYSDKGIYQSVTVKAGNRVDKPSNPKRSGYSFKGWYTESAGGSKFDFDTEITKDITLYAQWSKTSNGGSGDGSDIPPVESYTVTFESNGGSEVESQVVEKGMTATAPDNPTKASHFFTGWYSDSALTTGYDFTKPVTSNITLYAGWDSSAIDEEEYRVDTDNDSVPDAIEEILGLDPSKADSDNDGLPDDVEINLGYDGTKADTDENGVLDGDEDADGDGLTNLKELELGTDPLKTDSDQDGLTDSEEVNVHKTNPLIYDTDGDGVGDGYEVQLGTNPLKADASFQISQTAQAEGDSVSASVDIELSGEQVNSLEIRGLSNSVFFPEDMPGYLGMAYNFTVDGTFDEATISFEFDPGILSAGADPAIFYFNEGTQTLEELDTTIKGNVASAVVKHFSTYILIDRTIHYNSFTWEDVWDTESVFHSVEIVLVIDDSGSMTSNDSSNQRLTVAQNLIDKLPEDSKIGIVRFTSSTNILTSELLTDKDAAKNYLTTSYFKSSGGTYMYNAINTAFGLFQSEEDDVLKMMVVLSDGATSDTSKHASTITAANNQNVRIYTVGLGSSSSTYFTNYLKPLAERTGGAFYLAANADALSSIYDDINKRIDLEADADNDGIPDYYEDHMIAFNGTQIHLDKNNPDTDNDGLKDGEEVQVELVYNEDKSQVYVKGKMWSDPSLVDSDYDGIDDPDELKREYRMDNDFTALMHYSVSETILQSLTQEVSYYNTLVEFTVDYRNFFKSDSSYSKNLAVLGSLFVLDMYDDGYLDFQGYHGTSGKTNAKDSSVGDGASFEETFGLKDVDNYDANEILALSENSDQDKDDVTEFAIGHREVTYNGETMEIIFLMLRGTDGTNAEWSSNFDVGADSTEYYSRTGVHDDWSNTANHKGFDIAATRVLNAYEDYMEKTGLSNNTNQKCIFIAGHSRAAAIANIVGTYFEDDPAYKSFVYTFATPLTTTSGRANNYSTIFNIVNTDDIVTYLPLKEWGFTRYGTTKSISVKEKYESTDGSHAPGTFEQLFISDYNSNGQLSGTLNAFRKINVKTRADLYKLDSSSDGTVWITNKYHLTDDGARKELRELETALTNEKLLKFCKLDVDETLAGCYVSCNYCPAYLMQTLANMTASPASTSPMLGRDMKGVYAQAKTSFVFTSGKLYFGGMANPHMPPTYYLIAMNNFQSIK